MLDEFQEGDVVMEIFGKRRWIIGDISEVAYWIFPCGTSGKTMVPIAKTKVHANWVKVSSELEED